MNKNNVSAYAVIKGLHNIINSVDTTIFYHSERVAYIMFNLLKAEGSLCDDELFKMYTLALFHDFGAYKISEEADLKNIDVERPLDHSVYGALFIKYFSPLKDFYDMIITHHFDLKFYEGKKIPFISERGMLLSFADYLERFYYKHNYDYNEKYEKMLIETHGIKNVAFMKKANDKYKFFDKIKNNTYENDIKEFFKDKTFNEEEIIAYSKMLVYSIDFRSEATVIHTITVEAIAYEIALLYGFDEKAVKEIAFAAVLHDIGKISIPVSILEKPAKLTEEEFEIMKRHAIIGYRILSNLGIDRIRDIACLHHEKLDGSGYPFGLKSKELTPEMQVVAVSDIVSALLYKRSYKDKMDKHTVIKILGHMSDNNKVDSFIVNLFIDNYDYIIEKASSKCSDLLDTYMNLNSEYNKIISYFK